MYFVQLRIAPQNPKTPSDLIINSVDNQRDVEAFLLLHVFLHHFLRGAQENVELVAWFWLVI